MKDIRKNALKEGELVILKDDPEANYWYCAEIRSILVDRIEVNTSQYKRRHWKEGYDKCSKGTR